MEVPMRQLPRPEEKVVELPYKIAQHKKNWMIWLGLFNFDGCILPIVLFYSLWFYTGLSHWAGTFG